MRPTEKGNLRPQYDQLSVLSTSEHEAASSRFNALKHGRYAESILLPGDDAAEFQRERRALFHNYRPQTKDEADLVEKMAEHLWVSRRYRPTQARFDGQAVTPAADVAGRICEPVGHRRLHSGMDVTVQRKRIENMWHQARAQLVLMQKLRRQGLVEGAVALPANCYMETDGRVYGPVAQQVIVPVPEPEIEADKMGINGSEDGGNGLFLERKERGGEVTELAGQVGAEQGNAVLPGGDARPTGLDQGEATPLREVPGRRLIGGFGARRIYGGDFRVPERHVQG